MGRSHIIEDIHRMRFEEINGSYQKGRLSCEEAAEILGISVRTFYRKRQRYESEGFEGRFDLRIGRKSSQRAADREVEFITKLYADKYRGFSVKHFHEFAVREHHVKRSYNWTKNKLEEARLIKRGKRGGDHRLRRERRPMEGMMIHQDGSTHRWIPYLDYNLDLIVSLDDATSKITSAFLVEQEGTLSSMKGIRETIEGHGLFCSVYTDRGSHYWTTPEAGGKVDKGNLTQVGRALKQLGIRHIAAYSPQARGRSERLFGTLQDRLPKEFRVRGIKTIEEANAYLKDVYIPRHNEQFAVQPKEEKSAFTPYNGSDLTDILSIQEERSVQNDNTVRYEGLILQIPRNDLRHHYVRTTVMVHLYEDKTLAIFYGHLCLGRYGAAGNLIQEREESCHQLAA
jgi:transposase